MYEWNHESLKEGGEIIVRVSSDTGTQCRVNKCAEVLFVRGKMIKALVWRY